MTGRGSAGEPWEWAARESGRSAPAVEEYMDIIRGDENEKEKRRGRTRREKRAGDLPLEQLSKHNANYIRKNITSKPKREERRKGQKGEVASVRKRMKHQGAEMIS